METYWPLACSIQLLGDYLALGAALIPASWGATACFESTVQEGNAGFPISPFSQKTLELRCIIPFYVPYFLPYISIFFICPIFAMCSESILAPHFHYVPQQIAQAAQANNKWWTSVHMHIDRLMQVALAFVDMQ